MDKLPKGWEKVQLSKICTIIGGGTPKTDIPQFWNGNIYWLSPTDLPEIGTISIIRSSTKKITELGLNSSSAKLLPIGTVVFSSRASIGKIGITDVEIATNQGFTNFICGESVINFYLTYVLKYFTKDIALLSNSTTFAEVSKSSLKSFEIPLPPLSEQTRIVNKLDSLFERIDKSIALLEENIKHTEALMTSVLDEVFTSSKDSIEISKLVVKTENINPQNNPEVTYTYIDISSVNNKTHIIENPSELPGKDAPSRARKSVAKGDIVFATTRPNLRNIAVVDRDYLNPIASTGFCVLRANSGASKDFLFLCLLSNNIQEQIKPFIRGAQYPAISDKDLLQCKIPKLNFEEQIKVSGKVMRIREKLALLSSEQQSKHSYLKALKASLLDKAFKGEL